jgi:hypothetical protein
MRPNALVPLPTYRLPGRLTVEIPSFLLIKIMNEGASIVDREG